MRGETAWDRATLSALLAVAFPNLFGGLLLRAGQGPVLDAWRDEVVALVGNETPPMTMPAAVSVDRLHKSLSVARSLAEGRPVYQSGLLDEAEGRVLLINGIERVRADVAAALALRLDEASASMVLIAIDESRDDGEAVSAMLAERLAFRTDLNALRLQEIGGEAYSASDVSRLREALPSVDISDDDLAHVTTACLSMGIGSLRVPLFCAHAARAIAALEGRQIVSADDILLACKLVLPGRGQVVPEQQQNQSQQPESSKPDPQDESSDSANDAAGEASASMESQIIEAIASAPVQLGASAKRRNERGRAGVSGRSGAHVIALDRGRPDRSVPGQIGRGRIDVLATLRAAAPLQAARGGSTSDSGLKIRTSDIRLKQFKRRKQSSVIFIVDASGSAAMHRMAEAKGAVERLLSQCYSRRDLVSLISFSGEAANLVLPPSRSLVRARRQISDLAGGGATPLAHALVEAYRLAKAEDERGRTPYLVFLTDGRGNITLEGEADRGASSDQVSQLARTLIRGQFPAVFFDTSRRPDPRSRQLGADLGAQYQFLPNADGETVSQVVRQRIGSR